MKKQTERHSFSFSKETSDLLKKVAEKTDLNYTKIMQRGLEMFAKEKGITNED